MCGDSDGQFVRGVDLDLPFVPDPPIRNLSAFNETGQHLTPELMLGVRGARVIFANYGVLFADFGLPLARLGLAQRRDSSTLVAVEQWLVESTAYISTSQASNRIANTPIPLSGASRQGWRPPRYGRAALMLNSDGALFDVKGTGVPPDEEPHLPNSNGLLTLDEAVHEILMEHLIFAIMRRVGADVYPLPSYALIDLGFDAVWQDGRAPQRATILVRRAATRPRCQWERARQGPDMARALMQVELLLRWAGISASTCGAVRIRLTEHDGHRRIYRDDHALALPEEAESNLFALAKWRGDDLLIDGVNVQITTDFACAPLRARLMDFGRYRFVGKIDNLLYSWFDADYLSMNGAYLLPSDSLYRQPDEAFGLSNFECSQAYKRLTTALRDYQDGYVDRTLIAEVLRCSIDSGTSLISRIFQVPPPIAELRPHVLSLVDEPTWSP